jgi:Prokaryotic dksA/traR C4-type zinc finger
MDQVETLLRERSAGLRRTRSALREEAVVLTSPVVHHTLAPSEEPAPTGSCADCGGSIPAGRLRAIPTAVRCAGCQLELESRTV